MGASIPEKDGESVNIEYGTGMSEKVVDPQRAGLPDVLQQFSDEELVVMEKKLVRKVDFRILPILVLLFLLNILDRNAIANARLGGFEDELGLSGVEYQVSATSKTC